MLSFGFHPAIAKWFETRFGRPTEPQRLGWPAIFSGAHTLIAAPTGSGKTLAAFSAELNQLFQDGLHDRLDSATTVVYVSPLKALSNDIHKNLEEPLSGIRQVLLESTGKDVNVLAQVRTGDTPAAQRQAMIRRPPHILVTTPESLYLLITSDSGRRMLQSVRTLIVDEIHAVVGNRRGSHLALTIERLSALTGGNLQRIGLSATQKPIEEVSKFLVGNGRSRDCEIIDAGAQRAMDLALEVPGSPLEAVMSNEVWTEVYTRLTELIQQHKTTLVFVNTRRLAERVTHHLAERLGSGQVASHHASLSARLRLDAENRLKRGELKALVATASLELGIDIGSVDLVCQLGPTRSIATLLQRVGRAEHRYAGVSKGRIFPLTRDELIECMATMQSVRKGELDTVQIPEKPLDVLAQQIVACAAEQDWEENALLDLIRSAYPYRNLTREEFADVLAMLSEGFSTRRGRRGALIHYDAVNHRVRARRGARLVALTSGGAIPNNSDYRVVVDPGDTFIGTVNEDFAVESMAGDIFQLGSTSWRILSIHSGNMRVQDAQGQPPGIPFWLGEAPGRTAEVSRAVSELLQRAEQQLRKRQRNPDHEEITRNGSDLGAGDSAGVPQAALKQLTDYLSCGLQSLGSLPSQDKLILERFFDESGGMQLVIHSPFGIRVNRAWGLALRKRFCRSFNFELQAAASDDAIVLSLGTQHSFPLEDVVHYLRSNTVRDLLVQAVLDSPMFAIRWRWNAERALALPRQRGGRRIAAPLQRMESENLLAAIFPDQLACLENIAGDREIPDHPLVRQTIQDCLTEAMDIDGLMLVLQRIEREEIECIARDLPQPSPLAHEILNARPYAFLDNAPLEERRTRAVYTRRASELNSAGSLGILDVAAIENVSRDAWPRATNPDELHDALLVAVLCTEDELNRIHPETAAWRELLANQKRAGSFQAHPANRIWLAAERLPLVVAVYGSLRIDPWLEAPTTERSRAWEREEALRELVRGRMEISGPVTAQQLATSLALPADQIQTALVALEAEGFVLRGQFHPHTPVLEWCDRRLLSRIHRLTITRLRAEIQPVSIADFLRFLTRWQRVSPERQAEGPDGVLAVIASLDGFEIPAGTWEPAVLALRVKDYQPAWLDHQCVTGRVGWGRLIPPQSQNGRPSAPVRSSPLSIFLRENLPHWLALAPGASGSSFPPDTAEVLHMFQERGALFFSELLKRRSLMPSRVEQALGALVAQGCLTADTFEGLRALLVPADKKVSFAETSHRRRHKGIASVEFAGRWALLRDSGSEPGAAAHEEAVEAFAHALLRRYGVVFRRLMERESLKVTWYELGRIFRRLEARGEIRGGHFVTGVGGEQFALREAVGLLRSTRKDPATGEHIVVSGSDPLNLAGILTPGKRIAALGSNRLLLVDGFPVAGLEGKEILPLDQGSNESADLIARSLRVGHMPGPLKRYYAR